MHEVLDLGVQFFASELDCASESVLQRERGSAGEILNFLDMIYDMNGGRY